MYLFSNMLHISAKTSLNTTNALFQRIQSSLLDISAVSSPLDQKIHPKKFKE